MSAVTQQQQQGPGARRVSLEQIAAVQTMIEKCMQLYMAKDEVMACLKDQANIEVSQCYVSTCASHMQLSCSATLEGSCLFDDLCSATFKLMEQGSTQLVLAAEEH